jgi:hypothetical protein
LPKWHITEDAYIGEAIGALTKGCGSIDVRFGSIVLKKSSVALDDVC